MTAVVEWAVCPICRGEEFVEDEAPNGLVLYRACWGGCVEGHVPVRHA